MISEKFYWSFSDQLAWVLHQAFLRFHCGQNMALGNLLIKCHKKENIL
jgi:hypothetical protein